MIMENMIKKKDKKIYEKAIDQMFKYAVVAPTTQAIDDIEKKKRAIDIAIKELLTRYVNSSVKEKLNFEDKELCKKYTDKFLVELINLFEVIKEGLYKKYKKYFGN